MFCVSEEVKKGAKHEPSSERDNVHLEGSFDST